MELESEIAELDAQIEQSQNKRNTALRLWALATCPHAIGDVAKCKGYTFTDQPVKITAIKPTSRGASRNTAFRYQWEVHGLVINKDGSEGARCASWTQSDEKRG